MTAFGSDVKIYARRGRVDARRPALAGQTEVLEIANRSL